MSTTTAIQTTKQAFLADVIAAPEDDAVRLIFADWLEENGDPLRAEFIRVNVELARQPCRESLVRMQLAGRAWRLMAPPGIPAVLWQSKEHDGRVTAGKVGVRFSRGFVSAVRCAQDLWLRHGPRLVRAAPLMRVELSDKEPFKSSRGVFCWGRAGWLATEDLRRHLLDARLFERLTGGRRSHSGNARWYDSAKEAVGGLAAACLLFARETDPGEDQTP